MRKCYPDYYISKNKIELPEGADPDKVLAGFEKAHAGDDINTVDGVKVDMPEGWVHLRKSNTEPIIRLYAEAGSREEAEGLAEKAMHTIKEIIN